MEDQGQQSCWAGLHNLAFMVIFIYLFPVLLAFISLVYGKHISLISTLGQTGDRTPCIDPLHLSSLHLSIFLYPAEGQLQAICHCITGIGICRKTWKF